MAAIIHDPGQTLQSVKETLAVLAGFDDDPSALGGTAQDNTSAISSFNAAIQESTSSPDAVLDERREDRPSVASSTSGSARRKAFDEKLRREGSSTDSGAKGNTTQISAQPASATVSAPSSPALRSSASPVASTSTSDEGSVDRLLEEWDLVDRQTADQENLRLTDEEAGYNSAESVDGDDQVFHRIEKREASESVEIAESVSRGEVDPGQLADGSAWTASAQDLVVPELAVKQPGNNQSLYPLPFLQHAFPARTAGFLAETLLDAHGDVQAVIDTLMTLELIESEDAREAQLGPFANASAQKQNLARERSKGLDFEALAEGVNATSLDGLPKGKKRRAARRKMQTAQLQSMGILLGSPEGLKSPRPSESVRVNLTDVRQGAPMRDHLRSISNPHSRTVSRAASNAEPLSDAELAAKLDEEERAAMADPDADAPVRDNAWLLTSSVLAQLGTLLELEPSRVTSVYNGASFNLPIACARLVHAAADTYPSMAALDEAGEAPAGTASKMAEGIATLAGASRADAERALRATKGRQDAALDLLQLEELVRSSSAGSEPHPLDPLGRMRPEGNAAHRPAVQADAVGFTTNASANAGRFARGEDSYPTPSQAGSTTGSGSGSGSQYARAAAKPGAALYTGAGTRAAAAAALASGASGTVLPASSAVVPDLQGGANLTGDPQRRMAECRLIADDYCARRDEALRKAASAWRRAGSGGMRVGGKTGDGGRGGVAWHYADEARRLDAKARAWSLKAAHALVQERGTAARVAAAIPPGKGGDIIDLHGVTVHEALRCVSSSIRSRLAPFEETSLTSSIPTSNNSIVQESVNSWYSRPSDPGGNPRIPLRIVTGVGRHSPHQIAVIRPAVARMLEREGWRADVDNHRGVITVRGLK